MMRFDLTTPCGNCPFRSDRVFGLAPGRTEDIQKSLESFTFTCHKTTRASEDGERMEDGPNAQHCAGALILLEKTGQPGQMQQIAERLGLYDPARLNLGAPVFDTFEDMAEAQLSKRKNRT